MFTFYRLLGKQGTQFYDGEFNQCPDLVELILGPRVPDTLCVKVVRGKRPGDMMCPAFNVVSKRFIEVVQGCGATGFRACPIRVLQKQSSIPDYFLLKVTGCGGPVDESRSEVERGSDRLVMAYRGIYMDESKWDGADLFSIPGMGIGTYLVRKVRDAIKDARLLNVDLVENSSP